MKTDLKPDIWRLVVIHLTGDVATKDTKEKAKQQEVLAELSLVSKAFNAICTPLLYRHCQVGDPIHFLERKTSSDKYELLSHVKSLRIYDPIQSDDPSMADLFMGHAEWLAYGNMRFPNDRESLVIDRRRQSHTVADKLKVYANQFRRSVRNGDTPFPLLKDVVMTGVGDSSWGCIKGDYESEDALSRNRINFALLGLPSVQHYCQTSAMGPFSLPSQILKPLHPPKIVTFHYAFPEITWPSHFKPPLVLGATNRYIIVSPVRIATPIPLQPARVDMDCAAALAHVHCVIAGRAVVIQEVAPDSSPGLHPDFPGAALVPLTQVSLDGTFVEFYNTIKNVEQREVPMTPAESRVAHGWPLSRKTCEALESFGDQLCGRQWTGRIKIRNEEDIPTCPACGFDGVRPEGALHEWMDGVSTYHGQSFRASRDQ